MIGYQLSINAARGVLNNDDDTERSPLTLTKLTDPTGGVLTLAGDGPFCQGVSCAKE